MGLSGTQPQVFKRVEYIANIHDRYCQNKVSSQPGFEILLFDF